MLGKRTLEKYPLHEGIRVLLRADLNAPLKDGQVTDETRIDAATESIDWLIEHGARVIVCSHLGRPQGRDPDPKSRWQR